MAENMNKTDVAEHGSDFKTTKYDEADVFSVHSRISWSALFAGAVVALSVFLLLSLLGAAIGLSVNQDRETMGWAAAIWAIVSTLIALFLGGWVATQCTAGENMSEGVMYGVIHWGLVFAILMALTTSGLSAGFSSMLGVANLVSENATVNMEQLTQGVTNLTPEQREQMEQNLRSTFNQETASRAAWWTFGGMVLSMIASVGGALAGAGPSPMFRAFVIRPAHRPAIRGS